MRLTEKQAQEFLDEAQTGEILDGMLALGRVLGWRYRWTYKDTWWFALTGTAPYVAPLRVHYNHVRDEPHYPNMAEVTLIVEPWVDAKDVERVYRDVQRQVLGGDNRKRDQRTLDAVRFVAGRLRQGRQESWAELTRRWNAAQEAPERCYTSRSGLQQVFKRFVRAVYHPPVYKD